MLIFSRRNKWFWVEAPDIYSGLNITSSPETGRRQIKTEEVFKTFEEQENTWNYLGVEPLLAWRWVTHLWAKMKTVPLVVGAAELTFWHSHWDRAVDEGDKCIYLCDENSLFGFGTCYLNASKTIPVTDRMCASYELFASQLPIHPSLSAGDTGIFLRRQPAQSW